MPARRERLKKLLYPRAPAPYAAARAEINRGCWGSSEKRSWETCDGGFVLCGEVGEKLGCCLRIAQGGVGEIIVDSGSAEGVRSLLHPEIMAGQVHRVDPLIRQARCNASLFELVRKETLLEGSVVRN